MKERTQEVKRNKKRVRLVAALVCVFVFIAGVFGVLELGCYYTEKQWSFWFPDYEQQEISLLLTQEELTETEYETLYRQTGLTRLAIDDMRTSERGRQRILEIQKTFFKKFTVKSRGFAPFTYTDELQDGYAVLCDLKDGDIIVSATTRVSWWRYGHAALVVDGKNGVVAESIGPGEASKTNSADDFTNLGDFLVLRPKAEDSLKAQLVEYVMSDMIGLPYRFTVGILSKKYKEEIEVSQCAHFVWYAYKKFGIELDSDGGGLVKPQDIALSKNVELVQSFGFDLDTLWS